MTTEATNTSRVLLLEGGPKSETYVRALEASGWQCERTKHLETALARAQEDESSFELLLWDAESQGRLVDEAFDRGRFQVKLPTLLLLDRAYPFLEAEGRRPGVLDYLVRPLNAQDVVSAAEQNVRLLRAKRFVATARREVAILSDALAKVEDLLGRAGERGDGRSNGTLPLSERELEIARALAHGHRVTHIARMYRISPHTVRNHFKSIFRKMQVHSQVELLARLREQV